MVVCNSKRWKTGPICNINDLLVIWLMLFLSLQCALVESLRKVQKNVVELLSARRKSPSISPKGTI